MKVFITSALPQRILSAAAFGYLMLGAVSVIVGAQVPSQAARSNASKWVTFKSRAGWHIQFPSGLHLSSCAQCDDPTDPDASVVFSQPSGDVIAMIEPLAEKNPTQTGRQWLSDVARDTVIAPIVSEKWTSIDGAPALIVFNGTANLDKTENVYVLRGVSTFALRFPYIDDTATRSLCQQMLATFGFESSHK